MALMLMRCVIVGATTVMSRRLAARVDRASTAALAAGAVLLALVLPGCTLNLLKQHVHHRGPALVPDVDARGECGGRRVERVSVDAYEWTTRDWAASAGVDRANLWLTAVLLKLAPCALLLLFMVQLLQMLCRARQRRCRLKASTARIDGTALLLALIALIFLLAELPAGLVPIAAAPAVYAEVGEVIDLLALVHSTVNFMLYCAMSTKFRRQFALAFWPCCQSRSKAVKSDLGQSTGARAATLAGTYASSAQSPSLK